MTFRDPDQPQSFHRSPQEAVDAPAEELLYVACLHEGTGVEKPDFLAVIDAEEGRIVHELPMPNVGDELHHFGWNRCSSACHGPDRSHLIVPGFRSSRVHVVDVASDPRRPKLERVIEPEEIAAMMTEETWMKPDKAHELGFVDEVIENRKVSEHYDLSRFKNAPKDWPPKELTPLLAKARQRMASVQA